LVQETTLGSLLSIFLVLDWWAFSFNIGKGTQMAQVKSGSPEIGVEIPSNVHIDLSVPQNFALARLSSNLVQLSQDSPASGVVVFRCSAWSYKILILASNYENASPATSKMRVCVSHGTQHCLSHTYEATIKP
jgi:hypothetical protein